MLTVKIADGTTSDSIYWSTKFGVVGSPGTMPPGTLAPHSGGPVSPGTTVFLTYTSPDPVLAVLSVIISLHPVDDPNLEPSDGQVLPIALDVR